MIVPPDIYQVRLLHHQKKVTVTTAKAVATASLHTNTRMGTLGGGRLYQKPCDTYSHTTLGWGCWVVEGMWRKPYDTCSHTTLGWGPLVVTAMWQKPYDT